MRVVTVVVLWWVVVVVVVVLVQCGDASPQGVEVSLSLGGQEGWRVHVHSGAQWTLCWVPADACLLTAVPVSGMHLLRGPLLVQGNEGQGVEMEWGREGVQGTVRTEIRVDGAVVRMRQEWMQGCACTDDV